MKKKTTANKNLITMGYKVTNADFSCLGLKYNMNEAFVHEGDFTICSSGFHFCQIANDCFDYYSFDSENRVFEVEAYGELKSQGNKSCCGKIKFIRELSWSEVLTIVNSGKDNTGRANSGDINSGDRNSGDSNSGYRNSGDRNSGDINSGDINSGNRNSGDRNSGDINSGDINSGDRNSGDINSGYRNSGNWNSGDRNSGDSNSGYRNSGAFCLDNNPYLVLFDQLTTIKVRDWEQMEVCQLMYNIYPTIWVPMSIMSDEEKADHPKYETTEGYLKTISMHEAWANFWGNLQDDRKALFTSLPNFDAHKFEVITGIKTNE